MDRYSRTLLDCAGPDRLAVAQQHTIDPETFDKLRKVWAMRGSTHAGERAAAEQAAVRLVARFGYPQF
jgi:hypothetical protein